MYSRNGKTKAKCKPQLNKLQQKKTWSNTDRNPLEELCDTQKYAAVTRGGEEQVRNGSDGGNRQSYTHWWGRGRQGGNNDTVGKAQAKTENRRLIQRQGTRKGQKKITKYNRKCKPKHNIEGNTK